MLQSPMIGMGNYVIAPSELGNCTLRRDCPDHILILPKMLRRLDEIEENLLARRARAGRETWLGEVEGIDLTIAYLRQKREESKRLTRIAPVGLGMSAITRK